MNFLDPWYLTGLSGALVPLVLHFLSRRRIRSRPFSSLVFLTAIEHSAILWARITQRRLLALRVAMVAVTALALARPECGPPHPAATVIALDGSASMGAGRGSVWRQAQEAAIALAGGAPGSVAIGLAAQGLALRHVASRAEQEQAVRGFEPHGAALNMRRVLSDAAALAQRMGGRVLLVLVSDFQPGGWEDSLEVPDRVDLWGAVVSGAVGNLSIAHLSLAGSVRGEGIVGIDGVVERSGVTDDSCRVTLLQPQGEQSLVIPLSADEARFSFRMQRPPTPLLTASVVVDDRHGLVMDDRAEVGRWARDPCRVLVLGAPGEARDRITAALDPDRDGRWGFNVRVVEGEDAGSPAADVVVVSGAVNPGEHGDRVMDLWGDGAGLLLIADGERLSDHGEALFRRTMGEVPATISIAPAESPIMQYDHPVLAPFRHLPPHGLSLPAIRRLWTWRGREKAVISLGDAALLVESPSATHGRVLALMTGVVPPWSDWGSKASFVPIVQLAVDYASGSLTPQEVHFGVAFSRDIPWAGGDAATLHFPDGSTWPVIPEEIHAGVARVRLGPFVAPGLHILWRSGNPIALFEPVVPPSERAVAAPVRPASVSRWVDPFVSPWNLSGGRDAATMLLVFALGLLLGEAWLALRITRGAPVAEDPADPRHPPPTPEVRSGPFP